MDELLAGRQAETDKVADPRPEQTTPGREQGADPAADVWLRRRLDQNMAFWALAGLLLGGAGAYLPCLINTQLAWAVSGLVLVAVVALILCLRLWYRMRCQALGCRPAPHGRPGAGLAGAAGGGDLAPRPAKRLGSPARRPGPGGSFYTAGPGADRHRRRA